MGPRSEERKGLFMMGSPWFGVGWIPGGPGATGVAMGIGPEDARREERKGFGSNGSPPGAGAGTGTLVGGTYGDGAVPGFGSTGSPPAGGGAGAGTAGTLVGMYGEGAVPGLSEIGAGIGFGGIPIIEAMISPMLGTGEVEVIGACTGTGTGTIIGEGVISGVPGTFS